MSKIDINLRDGLFGLGLCLFGGGLGFALHPGAGMAAAGAVLLFVSLWRR